MTLIAHRFHSIEADGPWTSPPFPPKERRHIVQGVIGGYIMGRPRWAEDLDGNFIYGLDAKGKEMKAAPAHHATKKKAAGRPKRHHATKKTPPAQLQREIDETLAGDIVGQLTPRDREALAWAMEVRQWPRRYGSRPTVELKRLRDLGLVEITDKTWGDIGVTTLGRTVWRSIPKGSRPRGRGV